jgi:predicted RNA binding protein with dsRBD fold (UPF0201 family)
MAIATITPQNTFQSSSFSQSLSGAGASLQSALNMAIQRGSQSAQIQLQQENNILNAQNQSIAREVAQVDKRNADMKFLLSFNETEKANTLRNANMELNNRIGEFGFEQTQEDRYKAEDLNVTAPQLASNEEKRREERQKSDLESADLNRESTELNIENNEFRLDTLKEEQERKKATESYTEDSVKRIVEGVDDDPLSIVKDVITRGGKPSQEQLDKVRGDIYILNDAIANNRIEDRSKAYSKLAELEKIAGDDATRNKETKEGRFAADEYTLTLSEIESSESLLNDSSISDSQRKAIEKNIITANQKLDIYRGRAMRGGVNVDKTVEEGDVGNSTVDKTVKGGDVGNSTVDPSVPAGVQQATPPPVKAGERKPIIESIEEANSKSPEAIDAQVAEIKTLREKSEIDFDDLSIPTSEVVKDSFGGKAGYQEALTANEAIKRYVDPKSSDNDGWLGMGKTTEVDRVAEINKAAVEIYNLQSPGAIKKEPDIRRGSAIGTRWDSPNDEKKFHASAKDINSYYGSKEDKASLKKLRDRLLRFAKREMKRKNTASNQERQNKDKLKNALLE